jgi:hypothetical protein
LTVIWPSVSCLYRCNDPEQTSIVCDGREAYLALTLIAMTLSKRDQTLGTAISLFSIGLLLLYLVFSIVGFSDEALIVFALPFISAICFCIFILRKYRKENTPEVIDYLNVGTQRHLLGLFMIFYGLPKLFGGFFDYQLFALDTKLGDVSEFELAWYFYGKNRWQELFSGIMEFVPGVLLLNRRTYYLGAIILLPVTAQVFILNLFFKIGGVTFPAAMILLACNVYILYSEKEKIVQFIRSLNFSPAVSFSGKTRLLIKTGKWAIILLAIALVGLKAKNVLFKSDYIRKYEKLVGMYTLEEMKKNNTDYTPALHDSLYYKDLYIEKQSRWNILRKFNNKTAAFILELTHTNDSIKLYINKGGIGDSPDSKDITSVFKGRYILNNNVLTITGVQSGDTLQLNYRRQSLRPKQWFW